MLGPQLAAGAPGEVEIGAAGIDLVEVEAGRNPAVLQRQRGHDGLHGAAPAEGVRVIALGAAHGELREVRAKFGAKTPGGVAAARGGFKSGNRDVDPRSRDRGIVCHNGDRIVGGQ